MLKLIARINIQRLILGLLLAAAGFCLLPSPAARAQTQVPPAARYCTWLFWSKDPALIKKALERLAQGEPFMLVARDLARKNPKSSQANADCMQAKGMDQAVLAAVSGLQIGQVSRPFDLGGGTALVMRTTDEHRLRAQELYAKGRFGHAERELLRDLKLHPASAAAWHMLALTRTAQGHYKEALAALDKALSWSPDNPAMLNDKASALANLGRAKEALPVFQKALKLDPKNPTIMSNLAWALTLSRKKPKQAESLARQACRVAPKEARFWHTLGKIQATQGRHGEAVASLRQALVLDPKLDAAAKDLILSVKALNPKALASLDQPPALKPPTAKPEAKTKEEAVGKGLKPAPDLASPALQLPSRWPTLPTDKEKQKPEGKAAAKPKAEPKAEAKKKPEAAAAAPPSSGPRGRIVSLPMPKFPEPPPARAKDDEDATAEETKPEKEPAGQPQTEDKPKAAVAQPAASEAKAKSQAGQAKPAAAKQAGEEQAKAKPEAKPIAASKPEKMKTAQSEASGKVAAKEPATPKKPDEKAPQTKPRPTGAPKPAQGKPEVPQSPHYLIQVASYRPEALAKKELGAWEKQGQPGRIEKWRDKRGNLWHRVFLGPFTDKKQAEKKAKELKARKLVRDYYVVKRPAD